MATKPYNVRFRCEPDQTAVDAVESLCYAVDSAEECSDHGPVWGSDDQQEVRRERDRLVDDVKKAFQQRDWFHKILRRVEWVRYYDHETNQYRARCPVCGSTSEYGASCSGVVPLHTPGCELAAALLEAGGA